jgi:dihydrofolate reductase
MKYFKAIAAMAENRVIGRGSEIPWHLPEDFKWFKQMTSGQVIVMGRRTFESIGRPLPNRETVVLSRSAFSHPGVRTISDLGSLDPEKEGREIFICGGAEIYKLALPYCSDLYLSHVKGTAEGDVLFPAFEAVFAFRETLLVRPEFEVRHYVNADAMVTKGCFTNLDSDARKN